MKQQKIPRVHSPGAGEGLLSNCKAEKRAFLAEEYPLDFAGPIGFASSIHVDNGSLFLGGDGNHRVKDPPVRHLFYTSRIFYSNLYQLYNDSGANPPFQRLLLERMLLHNLFLQFFAEFIKNQLIGLIAHGPKLLFGERAV